LAITRRSLTLLRQLRTDVGALADAAVREIAEQWLTAWDTLSPVWQAAVAAVVELAVRTGRWPSSWQIARIPEVAAAVAATEQAGVTLAEVTTAATVTAGLGAITATVAAEPAIIAAQLPQVLATAAAAGYAAKILPSAVDVIRERVTQQVTALTRPLTDEASTAVKQALVRGVLLGDNPMTTARDMLTRVEGAFNGGLHRAATIARTEVLDSYRRASAYAHDANSDVLSGWTWICACDLRSCSACWSMHGTTWPLDQPGPLGHQSCRCARAPRLKPWSALGISDTEPDGALPDAEARFRAMSKADQLKVMGAARLELLGSGDIEWSDLAVLKTTRGWRSSYVPRTVTDLRRIAGRRTKQRGR
jgi:hypothetical protein